MSEGNGVSYTTKEAIGNLRDEMLSEFAELKSDVQGLVKDVGELKEFRRSFRDSVKVVAFVITIAVTLSMGLLYSGAFK